MKNLKHLFHCAALLLALLWGASAQAATTITYYHNDLLGSPVAATDASGHVIWRESYRPYGERLTNDPASAGNDVWYTSRRQDADTGLVYMGARYYDPVAGRFVSKDPVGFDEGNVQSFNRYAYANDNPYKYTDPDGRNPLILWGAGGYAAGVLADAASQYAAWGSVDFGMAMKSSAAMSGLQAGLLGGAEGVGLTIEKVGAEAISEGAASATSAASKSLASENKLNHIFGNEAHNLGPLVEKFGSREATFDAVQSATQAAAKSGDIAGVFETTVTVGEQNVVVRGNVIDGVARIGTFYIP